VDVHIVRDAAYADARLGLDDTEGPDLRAAQANLLLHVAEVGSHGVENNPESPQYVRRCNRLLRLRALYFWWHW
jgi:hypothetical protein